MKGYTSEIVTITPPQAQEWLEKYRFGGQRSVREQHVNYIANEIEQGRFEVDQIVLCDLNGHSFLTDGQHRLQAIIQTEQPQSFNLLRRKCKSMDEVEADYRRRDRGLTRSPMDCYRSATNVTDLGLTSAQINGFSGSLVTMLSGFEPRYGKEIRFRSADVRIAFMNDWANEAKAYFKCHENSQRSVQGLLQRSAVVAVALVTFRYQSELATEFWTAVAQDDGLSKGMPEKSLLTFLRENPAAYHSPHMYCRYVASAWNAKFERRDVQQLKSIWASTPMLIKGTPYNGKDVVTLNYA